jgi:hypothetical protein
VPEITFAVGSAVSPAAAGKAVAVGAARLAATKRATDAMVYFMMIVVDQMTLREKCCDVELELRDVVMGGVEAGYILRSAIAVIEVVFRGKV